MLLAIFTILAIFRRIILTQTFLATPTHSPSWPVWC